MIRIKAEPVNIVILQIYAPTTDADDEEIELICEQIEKLMEKETSHRSGNSFGRLECSRWKGKDGREVREFGLGKRNDRGQALIDLCKRSKLIVTNTWFQREKRRRYK